MHLPETLSWAIEKELENLSPRSLLEAREELTTNYRERQTKQHKLIANDEQRAAYIAARLPATYAVIRNTLEEVNERMPGNTIHSLLDLGAGPGSAMWAACAIFPDIKEITLIEKDPHLIAIGKRFAKNSEYPAIQSACWKEQDMEKLDLSSLHDLVTLSYSIGELPSASINKLLAQCFALTKQFLVIIEPGTPAGFARIRSIRAELISLGAHIVAPCPHANACPIKGDDWCHFSERIERSSLHRFLKRGSLGYEDEKFSWIAVSKTPCTLPLKRVLRHPKKHSGHISLTLCTPEGIKEEIISKRHKESYKWAKKAEWGSSTL